MTTPDLLQPVVTDEDLVGIGQESWASVVPDADGPLDELPVVAEVEFTGHVEVSGGWAGDVVVGLSRAAAEALARAMFTPDQVVEADCLDAVGEFTNIVGGSVKSIVPGPSALSLPEVAVAGVPVGAAVLPETAALVASGSLSWRGEPVQLTVWSREQEIVQEGLEGTSQ